MIKPNSLFYRKLSLLTVISRLIVSLIFSVIGLTICLNVVFIANQNINKVDLFHLNYHVIVNNETYVYDQLHNVCSTKFRINWSSWQQPVAAVEGRQLASLL